MENMLTIDLIHEYLVSKEKKKFAKIDKKTLKWSIANETLVIKYLHNNYYENAHEFYLLDFITFVFNKANSEDNKNNE